LHRTNRLGFLVVGLSLFFMAPTASGQGGGDCPQAVLPFGLGTYSTSSNPPALLGPGGSTPTGGKVLGVTLTRTLTQSIQLTELQAYTDLPSIVALDGAGGMTEYPVSGTALYAAGADIKTGLNALVTTAFVISDVVIASLAGGTYTEFPLPTGVFPVSAGAVGACDHQGTVTLSLCVELTNNSIQCVFQGSSSTFPIPEPMVATPESYTNGPGAGLVAFSSGAAYVVSGGIMTTVPLSGLYVSHAFSATEVVVQTTTGATTIPLGAATIRSRAFASCGFPMTPCHPSASIAMNVSSCPEITAAAATWEPPVLVAALDGDIPLEGSVGPFPPPDFIFDFGDQQVLFDPSSTDPLPPIDVQIAIQPVNPQAGDPEISFWSMEIGHDPALRTPIAVTPTDWGLTRFPTPTATILPDRVCLDVAVPWGGPFGGFTHVFTGSEPVATITYIPTAAGLTGLVAKNSKIGFFTNDLVCPQVGYTVVSFLPPFGFNHDVYGAEGNVQFVPVLPRFIRGDCNTDGVNDVSDPVRMLLLLFGSGPSPACLRACDFDNSSVFDLSDVILSLAYLFNGGPTPNTPFPECGIDGSGGVSCDGSNPPCP